MKVFILLAVFGIGSVLGGGKFFLKSDYYRAWAAEASGSHSPTAMDTLPRPRGTTRTSSGVDIRDRSFTPATSTATGDLTFCAMIMSGSELHIGDFNGDGRSDILCHDHSGNKWISYAQSNGGFNNKIDWHKAMGWCYHQGSQLLIADINGDGRDDLLCHDANGYKWVALANCHGQFTSTQLPRSFTLSYQNQI
ncbi:predicted protein [Nematostella vectensis]|uniref:VCBS repeat-containing protein n=1 Tax=Nematostella vectensis TaxID=45351 RepID=A7RYC5_NEMVE|nr:predicted protein [Nematostella vectensis]|eukprot:XP_001635501.1 predicted protein [Nematostella vectensis]